MELGVLSHIQSAAAPTRSSDDLDPGHLLRRQSQGDVDLEELSHPQPSRILHLCEQPSVCPLLSNNYFIQRSFARETHIVAYFYSGTIFAEVIYKTKLHQ